MYRKITSTWFKHIDFIVIDLICLLSTLATSYGIRNGFIFNSGRILYLDTGLMMILIDLLVIFLNDSYKGIIRRGFWKEFIAVIKHNTYVMGFTVFYLFITQHGEAYSRAVILMHWVSASILMYLVRNLRKKYLIHKCGLKGGKRSMLLLCQYTEAETIVQTIQENDINSVKITGLIFLEEDVPRVAVDGVKVIATGRDQALQYIKANWVDEVFVKYPVENQDVNQIINTCKEMGVTIHYSIERYRNEESQVIEKVGGYTVLSSSVKLATTKQFLTKRMMDIIGGLVGVIATGILFLFIAPVIYIKSPGPIFFKQERVGKGGKHFFLYKFRSMELNAEEKKAELLAVNEMEGGLMFKIQSDPRIIGGEKGIGGFIRKTSIDEFPQFLNVIKGEMSLVGTRPPTVDEWNLYEFHHRKRLSTKPGITGMWQVSGRSKITDFEEVVKLDTRYINEWSMGLDMRILAKTVMVVLKRDGSV